MKLRELNEAIAQTCDVRANVVAAVQAETFRQLRQALDKGEKVVVPEFGMFFARETTDEGGASKRVVRFRAKDEDAKKEKKAKKAAASENGEDGDA